MLAADTMDFRDYVDVWASNEQILDDEAFEYDPDWCLSLFSNMLDCV